MPPSRAGPLSVNVQFVMVGLALLLPIAAPSWLNLSMKRQLTSVGLPPWLYMPPPVLDRPFDGQVLESGVRPFPRDALKDPMRPPAVQDGRGDATLRDRPSDRDRLASRVDDGPFGVGFGREHDDVAVVGRVDRGIDRGVLAAGAQTVGRRRRDAGEQDAGGDSNVAVRRMSFSR